MIKPLSCVALAAMFTSGCGSEPPTVPSAEPPSAECKVPDPPAATPDAPSAPGAGRFLPAPAAPIGKSSKGLSPSGLKGLRPQDGPKAGLPLALPQMLSLRHPPSEMQWRALPPGSDATLTTIALDAKEDPKVRARVMEGLAVRAPEGGDAALRTVLGDSAADPMSRRAAARALSMGFAKAESEATAALIGALGDDDARLRETVVKALAPHVGQKAVKAALEARAGVEENTLVKEALAAALGG